MLIVFLSPFFFRLPPSLSLFFNISAGTEVFPVTASGLTAPLPCQLSVRSCGISFSVSGFIHHQYLATCVSKREGPEFTCEAAAHDFSQLLLGQADGHLPPHPNPSDSDHGVGIRM